MELGLHHAFFHALLAVRGNNIAAQQDLLDLHGRYKDTHYGVRTAKCLVRSML